MLCLSRGFIAAHRRLSRSRVGHRCCAACSALLLAHGWQFHGSWQQMLGHDFLEEQRFDIGLRREF